jgi:hypothetical protein
LVLVGPAEQCFTIHNGVLCNKSRFFRAACSTRWTQGQNKVVQLPDVDPLVFQRYVDWSYGDILVSGTRKDLHKKLSILVDLHLLADKLDDVKLRNRTITALTRCSWVGHLCPPVPIITLIWSNTTSSSALRKLVIDMLMLKGTLSQFEKDLKEYPAELVQQVALKFIQQRSDSNSNDFEARLAGYLEAEDGE